MLEELLIIIEEDGGQGYKTVRMENVNSHAMVVVLNPSLKLLSKIVNVIADDEGSTLIYEALISGQTILIPSYENNVSLINLPAALQKKAEEFMEKAAELGIQILDLTKKEEAVCHRKLITEDYVKEFAADRQLTVEKDALITPLAKDMIRNKRIRIVRR